MAVNPKKKVVKKKPVGEKSVKKKTVTKKVKKKTPSPKSLHSKNQMLEKENIELKKQLDDISKNNSKQMHS